MAPPDPRKSHFTFISGIKGSGKSEYARAEFYPYPFDRLVIDVTHDVTDQLRADGIPHHQLTLPVPGSWPEWMRDEADREVSIPGAHRPGQMTLVFRPDMGADDAFDDMDRALGLAMRSRHGDAPVLVWADEIGEICTAHRTGPAMKRALHHGRHYGLSLIMCGPRSKDVNPLCIGNCDKAVTFRMLSKYDREAIARNLGIDQDDFDDVNKSLVKYEHMVWERDTEEITVYEPLPLWRPGRDAFPP